MNELYFRKNKYGWICYDKEGRQVEAPSKDLAYRKFFLTFDINREPQVSNIGIKEAERGIYENYK